MDAVCQFDELWLWHLPFPPAVCQDSDSGVCPQRQSAVWLASDPVTILKNEVNLLHEGITEV